MESSSQIAWLKRIAARPTYDNVRPVGWASAHQLGGAIEFQPSLALTILATKPGLQLMNADDCNQRLSG